MNVDVDAAPAFNNKNSEKQQKKNISNRQCMEMTTYKPATPMWPYERLANEMKNAFIFVEL